MRQGVYRDLDRKEEKQTKLAATAALAAAEEAKKSLDTKKH